MAGIEQVGPAGCLALLLLAVVGASIGYRLR
jgi:hypothetical protein